MRLHLMQVARGGGLKGLTVDALVTLQRVRSCRSTALAFQLPGRNADPRPSMDRPPSRASKDRESEKM